MLLNPIAIHNLIHGNILIFFGTFQKMQQDQLNLKNRFSFVDDCPNIFCFVLSKLVYKERKSIWYSSNLSKPDERK